MGQKLDLGHYILAGLAASPSPPCQSHVGWGERGWQLDCIPASLPDSCRGGESTGRV